MPITWKKLVFEEELTAHANASTGVHGVGTSNVESTSGSQAKVDAHAALTNAHSATADATANRIVLRDGNARAKFAAPAANGEPLIKGTAITDTEHGSRGAGLHADSHNRSHALDSTSDHSIGSLTSGKLVKNDGTKLVDATNTDAEVSGAVTKAHDRQHALDSTSDHTIGSLASGKLVKSDGTKLVNATNTDTEVSDAVSKRHTQNTDTGLGTLGTKTTPVDNDKVVQRNSEASDALVTSTWSQIKSFLKTYFDTIYEAIGNAILKSLMTTKGDLIVAQGSANPQRLPVGADGKVLIADSSQTLGVKWGDPPTGSSAQFTAGDNLIALQAEEVTTNSESYVLGKFMRLNRGGTIRTYFELRCADGSARVYARIYRNGSAVGTERNVASQSWTSFTEDISGWNVGDRYELYFRTTNNSFRAAVRNFKLLAGSQLELTGGDGHDRCT